MTRSILKTTGLSPSVQQLTETPGLPNHVNYTLNWSVCTTLQMPSRA